MAAEFASVRSLIADAARRGAQEIGPADSPRRGWSAAERRDFYHLSLGGEIFPLAWARALESPTTRRPFLEGLGTLRVHRGSRRPRITCRSA